ncbi:MAG: hypothetical protein ACOC5S_00175 [Acidobacteriota bacterium]
MKQNLRQMQQMMERILQRPEVEEEAKKTVQKALDQLKKPGLTYREATEIQRKAFEAIGFSCYMGRFARGRGAVAAEPGACAVKLSVNNKASSGKVLVRQDPMLEDTRNQY